MNVARVPATLAELEALASAGKRVELIDGAIVELVPPMPAHGFVTLGLGETLARFRRKRGNRSGGGGGEGGWWLLTEVEIRLASGRVFRPDATGWRCERLPDAWKSWPIDVVPDWICEVVSTGSEAHDRVLKRRLYAQGGVAHYWILDPTLRTLEALVLRDGLWVEQGVFDETQRARLAPFEAMELDVGELFPPGAADGG